MKKCNWCSLNGLCDWCNKSKHLLHDSNCTNFIRFAGNNVGIFSVVDRALDEDIFYPWSKERAKEIREWFDTNLPVPPFEDNNWGNTLSWFYENATEMISNAWELVYFLSEADITIEVLYTQIPGEIVYADSYQIVAIPMRGCSYASSRTNKSRDAREYSIC